MKRYYWKLRDEREARHLTTQRKNIVSEPRKQRMTWSDGAHLGIGAERALRSVLGGEPSPTEDERMDQAAFEQYLLSAPEQPESYDDAARLAAKWMLEHLRAFPDDAALSVEGKYAFADDTGESMVEIEPSLYDKVKATHPRISELELTGFMVGWAANAARSCLSLPPQRNPALWEVEVADEQDTAKGHGE